MNIENLLNKYWEANTTLEEENQLHKYFNSESVSAKYSAYTPLFKTFAQQKNIVLKTPMVETKRKGKMISLKQIGIAASVMLALTFVFKFYSPQPQTNNTVSIETPEEALAYTKQALALVSNKLAKGSSTLQMGIKPLSKASIVIH